LSLFASPLAVRPKEASDGFYIIGDIMPLTIELAHFPLRASYAILCVRACAYTMNNIILTQTPAQSTLEFYIIITSM